MLFAIPLLDQVELTQNYRQYNWRLCDGIQYRKLVALSPCFTVAFNWENGSIKRDLQQSNVIGLCACAWYDIKICHLL